MLLRHSATTLLRSAPGLRAVRPLPRGIRCSAPTAAQWRRQGLCTTSIAFGPNELDEWTEKYLSVLDGVEEATDPAKSSQVLRKMVKSGLLKFTDMRDLPEKFFLAHRLLATIGLGGFGIRFTVQYNLFAGSIVGLGGPEQIAMLEDIQAKGQLGCFLLTEMQAGVLSGFIVETTADYDPETGGFVLHTPSDKAAKNWISQGYTAELGVVLADLRIGGVSHGPHAFHTRLRDDSGALMPGIRIEDMGTKTVANDLDNARVWFDHVKLAPGALLNKFSDVIDGEYKQLTEERMRLEVIGQRLLTGRMAIAEAALLSARVLHMPVDAHARTEARTRTCTQRARADPPHARCPSTPRDGSTGRPRSTRSARPVKKGCIHVPP